PLTPSSAAGGGSLQLNHSQSPLDNLVRKTSSRRVRQNAREQDLQQQQWQAPRIADDDPTDAYAYATDAYDDYYAQPQQQQRQLDSEPRPQYAYAYQPTQSQYNDNDEGESSFQSNSSNALEPPRRQMANLRLDVQAHFARDSIATASSSDGNSYYEPDSSRHSGGAQYQTHPHQAPSPPSPRGGDQDYYDEDEYGRYRYFADDTSSVYSNNTATRGPALRDSWNSTATHATTRRPDYYLPNQDLLDPGTPAPPRGLRSAKEIERQPSVQRAGRAPIVKPATANFSRPVREEAQLGHAETMGVRVTPQLPPDMHEQKRKVLERNARRGSPLVQVEGPGSERPSMESAPGPPPTSASLQPQSQMNARRVSPASTLYSQYSYYPYENAVPTPTASNFGPEEGSVQKEEGSMQRSNTNLAAAGGGEESGPRTPQEYLQLGIQCHEANRLQESARHFERSAKEGGGCGVGMLMYGLTLRHGWGCGKNEKAGFKWLMKAAESAVGDLEGEVGVVQ
ncbi:hypothetical protein BDZ97DRAFT_1856143, partial [Flammula alnicola]